MKVENSFSKVLYIDLSKKKFFVEERYDLFSKYLGGTGVATQLLKENCKEGADPLSEDNTLVLAVSPFAGVFPLASKTIAMFKSPLTGDLGESHAGGRSAVAIRSTGYGAIVINGKSSVPVYISIHNGKVRFRNAYTLWGMRSCFQAGAIIRERESGSGIRAIMRIGKAGENGVAYSAVTTETYRHFGRLGMGAVMGSKNLKALVVSGKNSIPLADKKLYREVYDQIYNAAVKSDVMKKYHDIGTSGNVLSLQKIGALPTRNLQEGKFEKAKEIDGVHIAEHYLGRRVACAHCPVGCIHIANIREPHPNEPYFYKTAQVSYDYELLFALGSMLGIGDEKGMLKLIDEVETYCLDAMSTGVVLAWATEMLEKGLITLEQLHGIELKWGDWEGYKKAVEMIVEQPNDFYKALAKGVYYASKIYGGEEFALTFGKNEMPGYHTGPGCHIGYAIGTRHSHLCNAGYSLDQKMIVDGTKETPQSIVDSLMKEEKWRQILSSLNLCFFARGIYTMDVIKRGLKSVGLDLTEDEINNIGERVYAEKYSFKYREGFSFENQKWPQRIFDTKSPSIEFDKKFMEDAITYAEKKIKELL